MSGDADARRRAAAEKIRDLQGGQAALPFDIRTRNVRGVIVYSAAVDGKPVTSARLGIGDADKRRKLAEAWIGDKRLHNNCTISRRDIEAALEMAEFDALEAIDAERSDDHDEGNVVTAGASYADDKVIVELAWNCATRRADFIVYDRDAREVSRSVRVDTSAGLLVVPSIADGIVTPGGSVPGAVYVPDEFDSSGEDEDQMRTEVRAFIDRYVELPGDAVRIVVEYVFLSWVFKSFDELPYIAFRTADAGRGKSRALETVGAICYRSMFVGGGSSAAATLRLLDIFGGTLVADEFDMRRDTEIACVLTQILNQGFQANRPLVKCAGEDNEPRPFSCFGPKLFALRRGLPDDATESRTLNIRMQQRTRSDIPLSLPRAKFDAEARALRNRLLAWRFANLGRVTINPDLAVTDLEDRLNQIGLPLLAVARTDDTRRLIVDALREQQGSIAADRADSLAGEVFAAAIAIVDFEGQVRPGNVAHEVNRRRAEAEGVTADKIRRPLGAQKAGWVLKGDLELSRDRDKIGTLYRLEARRAQLLCQQFGVDPRTLPSLQHCHPSPDLPPENTLFDSASAVGGNGGNDGNVSAVDDVGGDNLGAERPEEEVRRP